LLARKPPVRPCVIANIGRGSVICYNEFCQMLPVLFSIGPITIYTFAFLGAIGFLLSTFIIWRRLKDLGLKEEKVLDLIMLMVFLGLILARIFFVVQNLADFGLFTWQWFLIGRYPGFSFWGGLLGLFWALVWFVKKEKWDFWRVSDEVVFGLLPFLLLSQLGVFFDGSAIGKPTKMPWGVYFPGDLLRRQPVSLLFTLGLLLIWLFLLKIERHWRIWEWYKSKSDGFISLVFLTFLGLINLVIAFWRDTKVYFYWVELIASGSLAIGALLLFYFRSGRGVFNEKKKKRKSEEKK